MSKNKFDMLDAMFEVNRQRIEAIHEYCAEGGLERFVETSKQFYKLMDEQLRLIELMHQREKRDGR